ncbi:hypothetical protein EDB81DRAFT_947234 [Dactylonectria macrodidyma]|uniref:Prion-inhibition and propagation HeLo domain-containing protein n=1 Tax=Dactylonectria macrodidyma TaxID=307937 RepID=A0A9P9EX28_9HYPO|nr:hypothetical protein EDB81DRAFT_947234 [Dactylonectria macrodidyma]
MTKIVGTVASSLAVAALFDSCLNCFEHVQLGRDAGQNLEHCQVKLDVAKIRLDVWGQAVAINKEPYFATNALDNNDLRLVQATLEEILLLFRTVGESSRRFEINTKQDGSARFEVKQVASAVREKLTWALHDGRSFDKLAEQITECVDQLEKLFPPEIIGHRPVELEIEEVDNKSRLLAPQDAGITAEADRALFKSFATMISDTRSERFTEAEAREYLSSYIIVILEKLEEPHDVDDEGYHFIPTWDKARFTMQTDIPQQEIRRRVYILDRDSKSVTEKKAACSLHIQNQLELTQESLSQTDPDNRFDYNLVQFDSTFRKFDSQEPQYIKKNEKRKKKKSGMSKSRLERVSITAYFKRTPNLRNNCLSMLREKEREQQVKTVPHHQPPAPRTGNGDDEYGPARAPTQFPTPDGSVFSTYDGESVGSFPETSVFDRDGCSRVTYPTTRATSKPTTKDGAEPNMTPLRGALAMGTETEQEGESSKAKERDPIAGDDSPAKVGMENDTRRHDSYAETTYSMDSILDDTKLIYLQAFSDQLSEDLVDAFNSQRTSDLKHEYLELALKTFAWKLHGESSNPFQWWASVVLHRNRRKIVNLLAQTCTSRTSSVSSAESDEEEPEREMFQQTTEMTSYWLNQVKPGHLDGIWEEDSISDLEDEPLPFQFADYEQFVRKSGAYKWLLSKIRQYNQLSHTGSDFMSEIGTQIQNRLRSQELFRHISGRKPSSTITMTFSVDWDPMEVFREQKLDNSLTDTFARVVCLTGTAYEAQATTVMEYMNQTWPETGEHIITLIKKLVSMPEGKDFVYQLPESNVQGNLSDGIPPTKPSTPQLRAQIRGPSDCLISATGGPYFVSEIAEQIGWLAATLRRSPSTSSEGIVTCTPSVKDLQITAKQNATSGAVIIGSCQIVFEFKQVTEKDDPVEHNGLCWARLFMHPILVTGYPILKRFENNTGVEMSLRCMACLVRSREVVQWDDRIIIKGFSSLLVATLATVGTIVWHLLVSGSPEERISYVDPELDNLDIQMPEGFSLRDLEGSRHFVGWCAKATDMCGYKTAALNVTSSGLRKPPASIVIDKLYIEAGSEVIGGLNMSLNKKEQPFWLEREKDYPSLLKWVSLQPIVFYDVSDRRAWLVDGASTLLHLVRISLYLDEHDPESTYDWVFDASKFKDKWNGCTGRHAALKTLKSWDNLDLDLYVISKRVLNGQSITEHSKLETRVKKILHSIEILIDVQVKVASQDGVKIPHTFDPRRNITGFDVLDVISPLGPVYSRMQHIDAWGPGWRDLLPAIGITTIFGNGFGNLICPDDPSSVCSKWKCVPTGSDYLAASVSTLQMLHERRLMRMEPGLGVGELTKKVVWLSSSDPLQPCQCVGTVGACRVSPVQFLMPKRSWDPRLISRPMTPVDIVGLNQQGAVIFGHMPLLGRGRDGKDVSREDQESDQGEQSVVTSVSTRTQANPSTAGSTAGSSITLPSTITVPSEEGGGQAGEESRVDKPGKTTRTLQKLRKWTRK